MRETVGGISVVVALAGFGSSLALGILGGGYIPAAWGLWVIGMVSLGVSVFLRLIRPCPSCKGQGVGGEAQQAWDVPGVSTRDCPACGGSGRQRR